LSGGSNVVLDHITVSWGTDETVGSWEPGSFNITWSNGLVAEALWNSNHDMQGQITQQAFGALWGYVGRMSHHHSMYARCNSRNPAYGENLGIVDHRYNYIYSATNPTSINTGPSGASQVSILFYFNGGEIYS
jgi:hypothetical protein